MLEVEGGTPRLIARDARAYDWSPDSQSLALSNGKALVLVDAESGSSRTIVEGPEVAALDFSPSGKDIAWSRRKPLRRLVGDLSFEEDIYRSSIDGGKPLRLTRTRDGTTPVWGSRLIAFTRFEDDPLTAHFF